MQVGPFYFEAWHLLIILPILAVLGWFLLGVLVRVTGTWERVDADVKDTERITLVQFGPFVRGRRMMKGGFQEFNGVMSGRSIKMTRRDHGRQMIVDQGFPDSIAEEIDGSVTAEMRMTLSADGKVIFGTFCPQKIEFTHQPPQITGRRFMDPSHRRYKLISRQPIQSEVVSNTPKGKTSKFRKTV